MTIFVIFWCAVLCMVFFAISMLLKMIESLVFAAGDALVECGAIALLGIAGAAFLYLLHFISLGIRTDALWDMVGEIVMGVILIVIVIGIIGGFGAIIVELAMLVSGFMIGFLVMIFSLFNGFTERVYLFFLNIIKQKIECL